MFAKNPGLLLWVFVLLLYFKESEKQIKLKTNNIRKAAANGKTQFANSRQ